MYYDLTQEIPYASPYGAPVTTYSLHGMKKSNPNWNGIPAVYVGLSLYAAIRGSVK